MRNKILFYSYLKLTGASIIVGLLCCLLAFSLKHLTEYVQDFFFHYIKESNPLWYIIFPSIGITAIYFLRKYLFKNRKNKGIKEIYTTLQTRKDHLPFYKIPSHYVNGFLTVVFGGSTGIEVSTVVASASVGNQVYKNKQVPFALKKELVCAGVAAGVAVLFGSAIGGWLFAIEVVTKRRTKSVMYSAAIAAIVGFIFISKFDQHFLISLPAHDWKWKALPYMLILGILAGLLATFFTQVVIYCKHWFAHIKNNFLRVNLGALAVGTLILFFPSLYGDSYQGLGNMLATFNSPDIIKAAPITLVMLIFLKPLAASLTLGAGGDGGVFAPSIVAGAFLGILFAYLCNSYLGMEFIVVNFALIGAAATLAAAIHGPFTSIFLICSVVPGGYQLLFPLALGALVAYLISKRLCAYNVYTYQEG